MNKPVYLALLILLINEIAIYEFSYDYIKLKYEEKAQLCYVNIDSLHKYKRYLWRYLKDAKPKFDTLCQSIAQRIKQKK